MNIKRGALSFPFYLPSSTYSQTRPLTLSETGRPPLVRDYHRARKSDIFVAQAGGFPTLVRSKLVAVTSKRVRKYELRDSIQTR